jgi:integrase
MATVRKRKLPSGLIRWQASYVDAAGHRRAKLFDRKADGHSWLTKVSRDVQLGTHVPASDSPTVQDVCKDYLEHCRGRRDRGERMTEKCLRLYEGLIKNHILHPATGIGAVRIAKLSRSAVGELRDRVRNAGTTVQTTRKVIGTLSRVLDLQIAKDRLAINHARDVVVIGTRDDGRRKITVPTKDAIRALLSAAAPELRIIVLFAAATGVRAGELWALRWRHLDFKACEVNVETRVDAYGTEDVTKSSAGMRTIPLSEALVNELKACKLRSTFSKPDDLVFPNGRGKYVNHSNFLNRDWLGLFAAMSEAHQLDPSKAAAPEVFNWHALRHFAISCWIEAGLNPKTVQELAGHSTLAMTMDRYGHAFKSDDHKRAMNEIAGAVF